MQPDRDAMCSSSSTYLGLLHCCVAAGGRTTTDNRAESARERLLGFNTVQVPGVAVDTLERVTPNGRLEDRILLVRQTANTKVVVNRFPLPRRSSKILTDYETFHF